MVRFRPRGRQRRFHGDLQESQSLRRQKSARRQREPRKRGASVARRREALKEFGDFVSGRRNLVISDKSCWTSQATREASFSILRGGAAISNAKRD